MLTSFHIYLPTLNNLSSETQTSKYYYRVNYDSFYDRIKNRMKTWKCKLSNWLYLISIIFLYTYIRTIAKLLTNFLSFRYSLKRINKLKLRNRPNIWAYVRGTRIASTNEKDKNTTDKIKFTDIRFFDIRTSNCQL